MIEMNPLARIFVAGHRGLVGSAVLRRLESAGFDNILTATREQLDLRDQAAVNYWFRANRPEYVFLVAGTVGGILANSTRPAEFLYDNMMIHATVVHAAHLFGVRAAAVSGQLVHLSPREPSADAGGAPPDRPARGHQRGIRDSEDCGNQAVRERIGGSTGATSSPPCRRTCTARTTTSICTSSHVLPAHDPEVSRCQSRRRAAGDDLGHRHAAA